ncbi:MAG: 30S ribosomal protein S8 [Candidatus Pacearchaeota archaeon]
MSQDIISDALNKIMNAKRSGKEEVVVTRFSKVLVKVMEIAKEHNYIKEFKLDGRNMIISIGELHECKTIKPRYNVKKDGIFKYIRRYLPAKDMGIIIISTNKGMMTHYQAIENKIGGALIAYFF